MSTSRIEWTDATWNPIVGCTRCSPACDHCYAVRMAHRLGSNSQTPQYKGLTRMTPDGPDWTGEVRCLEAELSRPLKWRKPRRIFVGSMTDLFHEAVPFAFLDRIFAVMSLCPQHTFQVLTKRPERMREYLTRDDVRLSIRRNAEIIGRHLPDNHPGFSRYNWEVDDLGRVVPIWPLPNVWLGTTIWDQASADHAVPILLDTPAALRFVSVEPCLGAVYLENWFYDTAPSTAGPWSDPLGRPCEGYPRSGGIGGQMCSSRPSKLLSWVICGGETGPGARPMHPAWPRNLRDQCEAAGVAFFMKKMSGGGQPPEDLKIREFPNANA